jgi:transketolase
MNFGIDSFGVSSNINDAYDYFGLTPENISSKVLEQLKK